MSISKKEHIREERIKKLEEELLKFQIDAIKSKRKHLILSGIIAAVISTAFTIIVNLFYLALASAG